MGLIEFAFNLLGDGSWITDLATRVSNVIQSILMNVDFVKLGGVINTFITTLLNGFNRALQENTEAINKAISDFLSGLKLDEILKSLGNLLFTVFKLAITNAFELLQSSGILQGLLLAFIGAEILKVSASGILTAILHSVLKTTLVSAVTTVASDAAVTSAVTAAGTGIATGLGSAIIAGLPVVGLIAATVGLVKIAYDTLEEETKQRVDSDWGFASDMTGLNPDSTGFGGFWHWIFGKTPEESGELLAHSAGQVIDAVHPRVIEGVNTTAREVEARLDKTSATTEETLQDIYDTIYNSLTSSNSVVDQQSQAMAESMISNWLNSDDGTATSLENIVDNTGTTMNNLAATIAKGFNNGVLPAFRDGFQEIIDLQQDFITMFNNEAGGTLSFNAVSAGHLNSTAEKLARAQVTMADLHHRIALPLANGGVIPPNKPFLAMLGDQKQGTNIEAPLDTIVQAMQQALGSSGGSQEIVLNIDGETFARLTVPHNLNELDRKGYNIRVLEG